MITVFRKIFETLREYYDGKPAMVWWPENPVDVVFGAVLVQGANWKTVDRVLETLRSAGLLDFRRILETTDDQLASLIRPVGFQIKKTKRLKEIAQLFLDRSAGEPESFFARDPETIRNELLAVSGIGAAAADNILLYAGKIPIYMVDPFTTRILVRHGIVSADAKASEIQRLIHNELTPDEEPYGAKLFGEFQSLVVRIGRDFCDKTRPNCDACPLRSFLPDGGLVGLDEKTASAPRRLATASPPPPPIEAKPLDELRLSDIERKIAESLSLEPTSIDEIVQATELPVHIVRATIAILEMRKILRQVEGNRVRRL